MTCTGFPGPGDEHGSARVLYNPMSEYINRHGDDHLEPSFDQYMKKHGRTYDSETEHRHRLSVFRQNLRYINAKNRAPLSYKMKINKFADRTVGFVVLSMFDRSYLDMY